MIVQKKKCKREKKKPFSDFPEVGNDFSYFYFSQLPPQTKRAEKENDHCTVTIVPYHITIKRTCATFLFVQVPVQRIEHHHCNSEG